MAMIRGFIAYDTKSWLRATISAQEEIDALGKKVKMWLFQC
jgi:hypothetical protein